MQTVKLDPIAYLLILGVLGLQIYSTFLRSDDTQKILAENDEAYHAAVFNDTDNKGVMHQIFRQNELDRALLKSVLVGCGR